MCPVLPFLNFGKKWRTAISKISNCNIFSGEQDAVTVNNVVVVHWLNILCKRGGISNAVGLIAISATLTSRSSLTALSSTGIYRPRKLVSTSIQLTFQYGVLCNRSCNRSCITPKCPKGWLKERVFRFYHATACNATHGIAVGILSVRLSVRPSVRQMRVLWQVQRRWLSEVRSVKLLGSDKSGHSKCSERPFC